VEKLGCDVRWCEVLGSGIGLVRYEGGMKDEWKKNKKAKCEIAENVLPFG